MSASIRVDPPSTSGTRLADPLYFYSGNRQCFGLLHRPERGLARVGIVICNPFGYEAVCSHRSIRTLAEAGAGLGFPTLRFDYSGTGDSCDITTDSNQLELWCEDIVAAVGELQRQTGVADVCLTGIRLGALLAGLATERSKNVHGLLFIAPVIDGQRYLRELRVTRLAAGASAAGTLVQPESTAQSLPLRGEMEISGFPLFAATRKALANTDLSHLGFSRVRRILVLDEMSLPVAASWIEAVAKPQVDSTYKTLPGLFKMAMTAPHTANVPQAMIASVVDWLSRWSENGTETHGTAGLPGDTDLAPMLTLSDLESDRSVAISERAVLLGPSRTLFGIVTEPLHERRTRRAIVLLNHGANHHIGGSRFNVLLARHWARLGHTVLRLDLAGIGDSATPSGWTDDDVFPARALDDIRIALSFLTDQYAVSCITVGGLCSGGYHALRAAVAELQVDSVIAVNPQNYFWKEGMIIHELQLAQVMREPAAYYKRVFSYRVVKKLLTGKIDVWRILRVFLNSLIPVESTLRDLARRLHIRLHRDLGRELEEIIGRGVKVVFVFARGEAGLDLLRLEAGSALTRLGDRCRIHVIDSADHVFSQDAPRAALLKLLTNELAILG